MTKREMTTMATWEYESVYWGKELKGNMKKSHEKRDEDTATVHTETAQAKCIKGYKTQKQCQHASSVEANG